MSNIFKPKRSSTPSSVPTTGNLTDGELAVNSADKVIYLRDGSNVVEVANYSIGTYWVQTDVGIHTLSNVGIGTTNPQTKLEINGVLGFTTFTGGSGPGSSNIRIGDNSTAPNISNGYDNIFIGVGVGKSHTTGFYNNFIGRDSALLNTTGSYNNFLGVGAAFYNKSGRYNNSFGFLSGLQNISGDNNIFFGSHTGISTSASYKVILGSGDGFGTLFDSPNTTKDYQFAVGIRTSSAPSKYWLVGDENFNIGIGTTNPTSKLTVVGDVNITGVITASNINVTEHKILDDISSSFNGSTTQFTISSSSTNFLNSEITSAARLLISVGGVVQQPDPIQTNGYYITGGTDISTDPIKINFVEAPKAGQLFFGVAYGLTISPTTAFTTAEQSIAYSIAFGV